MPSQRPSEQNVVAIIQARMGSTRFPGKVLADLQGRPVLDWVVEAVKRVDGVDEIVVATTTNSEDQVIEEWCLSEGVNCFRGEPLDVLKRYADCAREYNASHVLRITADCPLLDSETVSTVLMEGLENGADYFGLSGGFPDGFDCEGFTSAALVEANVSSRSASDREHVTPFFKAHPERFVSRGIEIWRGYDQVRLSLDREEDLVLLRKLIALGAGLGSERNLSGRDYLSLLDKNPHLRAINAHIARNEGYRPAEQEDES